MRKHIENKHEGVSDYAATDAGYLKINIKYKHEGVRYPCGQCEYAATTASGLRKHIEYKHKGVRYPCEYC